MKFLSGSFFTVATFLAVAMATGCGRSSSTPPAPLAETEIPAAFEKAFSKANPELKELSGQFVAAMQAKDYSKAFNALQSLSTREGFSKEQNNLMARASMTVNNLLQTAQAQGDQKAAETIQLYNSKK